MNETLTGRTTREIVFSYIDHATRQCMATRRMPAGTEVYARPRSDGKGLNIRIPGTLFTQHVTITSVESF